MVIRSQSIANRIQPVFSLGPPVDGVGLQLEAVSRFVRLLSRKRSHEEFSA